MESGRCPAEIERVTLPRRKWEMSDMDCGLNPFGENFISIYPHDICSSCWAIAGIFASTLSTRPSLKPCKNPLQCSLQWRPSSIEDPKLIE